MSEPEDTSIALFNQNEVNPTPLSEILEEDEQNPSDEASEIGSTGVDAEENHTQMKNTEALNNFVEKPNYQDKNLDNFKSHGMTSQKHTDSVVLCKYYDHYYLETLLNETSNHENMIFAFTKSRNYVPKEVYLQDKVIKPYTMQPFFYYKIQIKDIIYCTYINEYYGPHRVCYKLDQTANNSNT